MIKRFLLFLAAVALLFTGTAGTQAMAADSSVTISVPASQPWTDSGISVTAGDSVSITASGTIYIAGSDPGKTPAGAPGCVATADNSIPPGPFLVPGLTCWSLIGRIGTSAAFEVGTGTTFTAASSGELYLGVDDNFFGDNRGAWTAHITITQADNDLAMSAPANITADATSPAGATVGYPLPAVTDPDDTTVPAPACSPSPGSVFAIGTTTVNCTASDPDDSAGPVTAAFTVTVKGAPAQIADLLQAVQGTGPGTSLAHKIQQAQSSLAAGDTTGACATLTAFTHEVTAQSGKSIPAGQASQLIADAQRIQAVLAC